MGTKHGRVPPPNLPLPRAGHTMDWVKGAAKYAGPTNSLLTTRKLSGRALLTRESVQGYVPHSRRAPPPRKLNASTCNLQERCEGHIPRSLES